MNRKNSETRVPERGSHRTAADKETYSESSTGIVPSQTEVIAVGTFRADLLDYMRGLPFMACSNDHFSFKHDGPNSVLACGFERRDGSEAVVLEMTLHNWHPQSSIDVLDLCSAVADLEFSAESALERCTRHGKTILTKTEPRQLAQDLRELKSAASKLFDRIEDQANWLPIPDDVVVSVKWFAVEPSGGCDE